MKQDELARRTCADEDEVESTSTRGSWRASWVEEPLTCKQEAKNSIERRRAIEKKKHVSQKQSEPKRKKKKEKRVVRKPSMQQESAQRRGKRK